MPDALPLTTQFLVYSRTHSLAPFARRLTHEGMDADLLIYEDRYQKVWDGIVKKRHGPRGKDPARWTKLVDQANAGELVVLTDTPRANEMFMGAPRLFSSLSDLGGREASDTGGRPSAKIAIGAWFDGEGWQHPHWLVPDWGAWPGGMGPQVLGGLTLIHQPVFHGPFNLLADQTDELKARDFRGLVTLGLTYEDLTKSWQVVSVEAGWPFLHTHAFMWEMPMSSLLLGLTVDWAPKTFTVAIPVSLPPWPLTSGEPGARAKRGVPLTGLSEAARAQMYFHDFKLAGVGSKEMYTAESDGLVGVAIGTGNTLGRARFYALAAAGALQVRERQFRSDVGAGVEKTLLGLEEMGLY